MKSMNRRKFLLGASGSAMALPWLEVYAEDPKTKKAKDPSLRFASFYSPMGFVRDHFFPEKGNSDFLSMPTLRHRTFSISIGNSWFRRSETGNIAIQMLQICKS